MTPTAKAESEPVLDDEEQLGAVLGMRFAKEQLAAITAPLGPSAIIAGAGSGKTTVMAARVVWLVGRGLVGPDQVLGLTFSNKAAAELGARVRTALSLLSAAPPRERRPDEGAEPRIATYHAYAAGLVAEHGLRLGLEPDLRLVTDASCYQRAARVIAGCTARLPTLSTDVASLVRDVVRLDGQLWDHLVDLEELLEFERELCERLAGVEQRRHVGETLATSRKREELAELVARYRAAKAADGVTDFSEQMAHGAWLATRSPVVSRLERERYRVVLLDEYQDTSVSQRLMLQGLFSGATAAAGRGHPVSAVGDPCQAIYGWRGASADNLDAFPEHFVQSDGSSAPAHELIVNRRCDRAVLGAANTLAAPLLDVHRSVGPAEPRSDAGPGAVETACLGTVPEEIRWLVERVRAVHRDGDAGDVAWSDIAILLRDGSEFGALAVALRRAGVPVEIVGLSGLLQQPEVRDVVATLHVVQAPTANAALLRLLTGPRWRIGARDLALLGRRARALAAPPTRCDDVVATDRLAGAVAGSDPTDVPALSEALEEPGRLPYSAAATEWFGSLAAELRQLRSVADAPLVELVRRVIECLGLDVELGADPGPDAAAARDNLSGLLQSVEDFVTAEPAARLDGFLAYLSAEEECGGIAVATASPSDSVKVMTVHKAKGLEWPVVFVPFLADRVFPNERGRSRWTSCSSELPFALRGDAVGRLAPADWGTAAFSAFGQQVKDHSLLEERRLGYVACTRAKRLLIASAHWWGRTQKRPRGPSEYLRQLRARHEEADAVSWEPRPQPGTSNPLLAAAAARPWPADLDADRLARRSLAAQAVRDALAAAEPGDAVPQPGQAGDALALRRLHALDAEIDVLLGEAQAETSDVVSVPLPAALSVTAALRMRADPDGFAAELARPMPRPPSRAAHVGTRFHAWVESDAGQQALLEPYDLPGAADADFVDEELGSLRDAFRSGPFGDHRPRVVEAPFSLKLAGQVLCGRIDAVYDHADGCLVVDWKTSHGAGSDPLQLAIYRLAWAEMHQLPLERVRAAFYYVRTSRVVAVDDLPDRPGLERLLRVRR